MNPEHGTEAFRQYLRNLPTVKGHVAEDLTLCILRLNTLNTLNP